LTPAQCRAARGFLDWTQNHLAETAGTDVLSVAGFERGDGGGAVKVADRLRRALESAGIEFTNGGTPGVRLTGSGDADQSITPDELNSGNDV
jgi:transcriptional regulator with XRE-family HTH domain